MPEYTMAELLVLLPRAGRLEWIGLRPARRGPLTVAEVATADTDRGLRGDHFAGTSVAGTSGGKRQVTLIQAEHLPVIAALCAIEAVPPQVLRRNLLVSGINLLALKDRCFSIGEVWFEGSGVCAPCSRMEMVLGPGGYNAMRGHGGITARVRQGGVLRVGDVVVFQP